VRSAEQVGIEAVAAALRAIATDAGVQKPLACRAPKARQGNLGDPADREEDQSPGRNVPGAVPEKERPVEQQHGKAVQEAGSDDEADRDGTRQPHNPPELTISLGDRTERFLIDGHVLGAIVGRFRWHVAALNSRP